MRTRNRWLVLALALCAAPAAAVVTYRGVIYFGDGSGANLSTPGTAAVRFAPDAGTLQSSVNGGAWVPLGGGGAGGGAGPAAPAGQVLYGTDAGVTSSPAVRVTPDMGLLLAGNLNVAGAEHAGSLAIAGTATASTATAGNMSAGDMGVVNIAVAGAATIKGTTTINGPFAYNSSSYLADWALAGQMTKVAVGSGNSTSGFVMYAATAVHLTGVRFYWGGTAKSIKCTVWNSSSTSLSTITIAVGATSLNTATFSAAVAITAATKYTVGCHETGGSNYMQGTAATSGAPAQAQWVSPVIYIANWVYETGDVIPAELEDADCPYPIVPVYTVP